MSTCRVVLAFLLLSASLALGQNSPGASVNPMAGTGTIQDNAYTNTFFGFTYRFPAKWNVLWGPDHVAAAGCGHDCRLFEAQAPKGRGNVQIRAYPLPVGTSARDFLQKITAAEADQVGLKRTGSAEFEAGGWKFYRADYKSQLIEGDLLQTFIVAGAKEHALLFTILADSRPLLLELTKGIGAIEVQNVEQTRK